MKRHPPFVQPATGKPQRGMVRTRSALVAAAGRTFHITPLWVSTYWVRALVDVRVGTFKGVPDETMRIIELLNLADPGGMAFRYAGELPQRQDNVDFPSLKTALHDAYEVVSAAEHMLDCYGQNQSDWLAYKSEVEAEMRAEFAEDMGYRGY